jgi:F0F1-type ATP synthase membrane subunit c/vacuolar-type H+-ATPase subunit K
MTKSALEPGQRKSSFTAQGAAASSGSQVVLPQSGHVARRPDALEQVSDMDFISTVIVSVAALLALLIVFHIFRSRSRYRVSIRLRSYTESSAPSGEEKGFEAEVQNRGLPLTQLGVQLYVRHSFGESVLSGMHGCDMTAVETLPAEIASGQTVRFRLAEKDLEQPTLLTTAQARFVQFHLREMKPNEVAIAVHHSGGQLLSSKIVKARISPEVLRRGQAASANPERPLAAVRK